MVSTLSSESCVTVRGKVIENAQVKLGGFEIVLTDVRVESAVEALLPFDVFSDERPAQDKRLDWRFLDLRRPKTRSPSACRRPPRWRCVSSGWRTTLRKSTRRS